MFLRLPDAGPRRLDYLSTSCFLQRSLRIMCLGDRLSSGTCLHGQDQHPYSGNLYLMLSDEFPRLDVHVHTDAVDNDHVVSGTFVDRLAHRWDTESYDWTIVLGGTNDLLNRKSPRSIFRSLQKIWGFALAREQQVLALTVPESTHMDPKINQARTELNALIMGYTRTGFHAFDLDSKIPYYSLEESARRHYWDDGLHLSEDGYDWMGGFIADELIRILRGSNGHGDEYSSGAHSASASPSREPYFRSSASVATNDINTRKPHELPSTHPSLLKKHGAVSLFGKSIVSSHSARITITPLASPSSPSSHQDLSALAPRSARSSNTSLVSSSSPDMDDSRGSVSPVYSLATTVASDISCAPPPSSSPHITTTSLRSGSGGHVSDSERQGRRHARSMCLSNMSKVQAGGIQPTHRRSPQSKRSLKRAWDMAVPNEDTYERTIGSPTGSDYVMVAKKDIAS